MVQEYRSPLLGMPHALWQGTEGPMVRANVVFGQPSLACRGNGLCRVDLVTAMSSSYSPLRAIKNETCERIPVRLYHDENEGLQLTVSLQELPQHLYARHFSTYYFSIEEDFYVSEVIVNALNLKNKVLSKGKYRIKKTVDCIVVYLSQPTGE